MKKYMINSTGAVAILVAITLVVLIGITALAVDVGYLMTSKNELQNAADASALAATRQLGAIYEPMSYTAQQGYVCNPNDIVPIAQATAASNRAAGQAVSVQAGDVIIGTWDTSTRTFSPTLLQPNAVRVVARREAGSGGEVATFFARIFNIDSVAVRATATAALTSLSTAGPGGLPVPIGISYSWFTNQGQNNFCNQPIRFYPTNDPSSCGGWHVYDRYTNAPDRRLRETIQDIESYSWQNSEVRAGETVFRFTNGTMSTQTYDAMYSLFNSRRVMNDGIIDNDTDSNTWTATVPVYAPAPSAGGLAAADCGSPHDEMVWGFATIVITGVSPAPVHQIDGRVVCQDVEPGRGGGVNAGTLGSIPNLVQ